MSHTRPHLSSVAGRVFLFLLICLGQFPGADPARGQQQAAASTGNTDERIRLHQALLDISNPWTVMCVAAHPDDEDGATLTVLRRKYGVHTVTVFSTYGEGGQNAIGPELYEELGAIRARETRSAAEIQGSEPWFLALRDFGFSKSAEEALSIWGHDEALRRLVLKIRMLRPDVIITNHDTASGHGHHQATGRLVLEAFDAAADPHRFPEQLRSQGLTVWQVERLFVRINYEGGTGSKALEEAAERAGKIVSVNPNEHDPVRGTTYAEQALQALHQHASQGPWPESVPKEGAPVIRYRLAREAKGAAQLPAGAQTFLAGLRLPADIAADLKPPADDGRPLTEMDNSPGLLLSRLISARESGWLQARGRITDAARLELMNERFRHALAAASGVLVSISTDNPVLVPGTNTTFTININNHGSSEVIIKDVKLVGPGQTALPLKLKAMTARVAPGESLSLKAERLTPPNAPINLPRSGHLYDELLEGQRFVASVSLQVGGLDFPLPLMAAKQLDVGPPVEIAGISPSPLVLTPATINRPHVFELRLINHQPVRFDGGIITGRAVERGFEPLALFQMQPGASINKQVRVGLSFNVMSLGSIRQQPIPNVVPFSILDRSTRTVTMKRARVVYSDARVAAGLRVGYIRSFDRTLSDALNALGVEARELTVEDVRTGDLQRFDTIIIDNRGYQAHPELIAANRRLLEYVRSGGTLIVFYHKANEWNPDEQKGRPQLAPYPLTLDSSRVTNEKAPVSFAEPQSPLLNFPNRIDEEDFNGWVQERGLYYPKQWDAHYSAPLSMSDAGEAPLRGGLLATEYGRGRYIYTSIVWYRQLRAGVPGAFRFFANMISYGRAPAK